MRLTLIVNNTRDLDGGTKSTATFDEAGGIIGATEQAHWCLSDRDGTVDQEHLRVAHVDGHFCLEVLAAGGLQINGSDTSIRHGEMLRVTDGDTLTIGRFDVSAYVTVAVVQGQGQLAGGEEWARRFVSVGGLIGDASEEQISGKNLFDSKIMRSDGNIHLRERLARAQQTDPIEILEEQNKSRTTSMRDPVAAFDREQKDENDTMVTKVGDLLNATPEDAQYVELPDDLQPGSAHIVPPTVRRGAVPLVEARTPTPVDMDSYLETLAENARDPRAAGQRSYEDTTTRDRWIGNAVSDPEEEQLVDHVVLRPLCHALGLPIQSMTVPQANRLAHEVGAALKAAITGIMEAHKRELSDKSHLAETHLHAIEDNPLRLEQSVDEAVKDLFLIQSPVHLSASAAIGESLQLLRFHQQASETAAEEALDAVLRALGPLALAKRFLKYKGHAPRSGDLDAWHWSMYQHYYAEMRSDQQGGLSRMFWEVYRQVYDREMRRRSMEG